MNRVTVQKLLSTAATCGVAILVGLLFLCAYEVWRYQSPPSQASNYSQLLVWGSARAYWTAQLRYWPTDLAVRLAVLAGLTWPFGDESLVLRALSWLKKEKGRVAKVAFVTSSLLLADHLISNLEENSNGAFQPLYVAWRILTPFLAVTRYILGPFYPAMSLGPIYPGLPAMISVPLGNLWPDQVGLVLGLIMIGSFFLIRSRVVPRGVTAIETALLCFVAVLVFAGSIRFWAERWWDAEAFYEFAVSFPLLWSLTNARLFYAALVGTVATGSLRLLLARLAQHLG